MFSSLLDPKRGTVALTAFANAVILLLVGFDVVHWDVDQVGSVVATVTAGSVLLGAVWAHLRPGTSQEPVALGFATVAFVTTCQAMLVSLHAIDWTVEQQALVTGVVVTFLGLLGIAVVREAVTPWPKDYPYSGAPISPDTLGDWTEGAVVEQPDAD